MAADFGIVLDFMSLPQRGYTTGYIADEFGPNGEVIKSNDDRTPYEQARFAKGLKAINMWYAAQYVTTLVLDLPMPERAENVASVEQRGWCVFERRLSSITKWGDCCLMLSRLPPGTEVMDSWEEFTKACKSVRYPPLSPDAFETMMRAEVAKEAAASGTGLRFTNGKDATEVCIPQYHEAFVRLWSEADRLQFGGCSWGDEEEAELVTAVEWALTNGQATPSAM
eukprot:6437905-Prymnesium_polylepis.1